MTKDVVFQSRERMFHRRSAKAHHLRRCSLLHALERLVVPVARYHALGAHRAARLQRTGSADFGPTCVVYGTVFPRYLLAV